MKWFILIAVLIGVGWTANWSYHLLDDAVLITDYWPSQGGDQSWKLINYIEGQAHLYAFNSSNGYWAIFKSLWPVWTLFILSFIILIPLARYIYVSLNDTQIVSAKEAQMDAEKQAKKAQSEARSHELKIKSSAEEQINNAYQKQLSRVKKEPATVSPERPTAENKETQPTWVLYMDRLSYRSCIRISPSNNSSMPTILG